MKAGKALEQAEKALKEACAACEVAEKRAKLAELPDELVKQDGKQPASQPGEYKSYKQQLEGAQEMPAHVLKEFPLNQHMQFSKLDEVFFLKMQRLKYLWDVRVQLLTETGGASSAKAVRLTGCNVFILGLLVHASDPQHYNGEIRQAESLKALAEAMPQGTLQCDGRGNAYSFGTSWVVKMVEMKSFSHSSEWHKGIQQLAITLRAVGKALQLCKTKLKGTTFGDSESVSLVGVLVVDPKGSNPESVHQCVRDNAFLYTGSDGQGTELVQIKVLFCK